MRPAVLALILSSIAVAQQFSDVDALTEAHRLKTKTPGIAIAIVQGDRITYAKGYGRASAELPDAITPDHLFRAGSTTKMFVAATVVRLAERGAIKLDEPIGKYVADLETSIGRLTAHQILSHTGGLWDITLMYGSHDDEALASVARALIADSFFTKPGAIYSYSNLDYVLAGRLAEVVHRKPMADTVRDLVFEPLGMTRTTFRPTLAMTYPFSQGHTLDAASGGEPKVVRPVADHAGYWPAGSMFTSARDMARMVVALMNDGRVESKPAIDIGTVRAMLTRRVDVPSPYEGASYGYGLQFAKYGNDEIVEHGGARLGYTTHLMMIPAKKTGVVVLTNSGGGQPHTVAEEILKKLGSLGAMKPRAPIAVAANEIAGIYTHAGRVVTIQAVQGKAVLKQAGGSEISLEPSSGACYRGAGSMTACFTRDAAGSIRYATLGGRSWERR